MIKGKRMRLRMRSSEKDIVMSIICVVMNEPAIAESKRCFVAHLQLLLDKIRSYCNYQKRPTVGSPFEGGKGDESA